MTTKAEIINNAYSQMRISGLTVDPSPADITLALDRLESMAAEFEGRNIKSGYNLESTPDVNSEHNMLRKYWYPYEVNLAVRLLPDFGKPVPQILFAQAQAGLSFLASDTAEVTPTAYPRRQAIGSGNRRYLQRQRFYQQTVIPPNDAKTIHMYVDDVNDYTEDFSDYLVGAEEVASYTIEADDGLTVSNDSLTNPVVSYRVTATGTETSADNFLRVKIVATTDNSRIITRIINFQLTEVEID
jgi:hypothetical protein